MDVIFYRISVFLADAPFERYPGALPLGKNQLDVGVLCSRHQCNFKQLMGVETRHTGNFLDLVIFWIFPVAQDALIVLHRWLRFATVQRVCWQCTSPVEERLKSTTISSVAVKNKRNFFVIIIFLVLINEKILRLVEQQYTAIQVKNSKFSETLTRNHNSALFTFIIIVEKKQRDSCTTPQPLLTTTDYCYEYSWYSISKNDEIVLLTKW